MPIHLCIHYRDLGKYGAVGFYGSRSTIDTGVLLAPDDNYQHRPTYREKVLIHELCHANQRYYQNYTTKKGYRRDTPAGRELIRIVRFKQSIVGFKQSEGDRNQWELPSHSPYRNIYSTRPQELGAEICALFIYPQVFLDSYAPIYVYTRHEIESVINNPQLQQWFNTYIKNTASLSVHATPNLSLIHI